MRALVTGAAGFVGSNLVSTLIGEGHTVLAVDSLNDYYSREQKLRNVRDIQWVGDSRFEQCDLLAGNLDRLMDGVDWIFHQAGQPGVRNSWESGFGDYVSRNIVVTQRLLEMARALGTKKFVYASSSSVYGDATVYPTPEEHPTLPLSPYGVTKLAAEHLCHTYGAVFGVPTVSLRYFTVYGPRQRPDMAIYRLIKSALTGESFQLFGNGTKSRDFTYVGDVVRANMLAAEVDVPAGSVFNICGGVNCSMTELVDLIGAVAGSRPDVLIMPDAVGDVDRTGGDSSQARVVLGWEPKTALSEGLKAQLIWQESQM